MSTEVKSLKNERDGESLREMYEKENWGERDAERIRSAALRTFTS
jgi:hypothetical protein